jgi:hypothetical protein
MCIVCHSSVKKLETLTVIDCSRCNLLIHFPESLPNLVELRCYRCPKLLRLPSYLPNLRQLEISNCPHLHATLPDSMPALETLKIRSEAIFELPSFLPRLTILDVDDCLQLTHIPDTLPALQDLTCLLCPKITNIPKSLVNLTSLFISRCNILTQLPIQHYPNIQVVWLFNNYWLDYKNRRFQKRLTKLRIIQRRWKTRLNNRKLWRHWILYKNTQLSLDLIYEINAF